MVLCYKIIVNEIKIIFINYFKAVLFFFLLLLKTGVIEHDNIFKKYIIIIKINLINFT